MAVASGLASGYTPTLYRTVAASTSLLAVSGAPKRCAAMLIFTNPETSSGTAVFQGPDAVNVTATIPAASTYEVRGNFAALGAFGTNVTCVVGWVDDGSVQLA